MRELALVFIGGGLGSLARYFVSRVFSASNLTFPFATLTSNFLSCVVFGFVVLLLVNKTPLNELLKLTLLTGFCGGFSTFSSFTFETSELVKSGSFSLAVTNILVNILLSAVGLFAGMAIFRLTR